MVHFLLSSRKQNFSHSSLGKKKITFVVFFQPNTFRDKSSQVLTLFQFVLRICPGMEVRYSSKKLMMVKQRNLTAFHFLYVLVIHLSENLYLFQFSQKLVEFKNSKAGKELSYYWSHLPFQRSCLVESLLKLLILFSFLSPTIHRSHVYRPCTCFAAQIRHREISYIHTSVSVLAQICKIQELQPDINIKNCCVHFMCENETLMQMLDCPASLSLCS